MRVVIALASSSHPHIRDRRRTAASASTLLLSAALAWTSLGCGARFQSADPTTSSGGAGGSTSTTAGGTSSTGGGATGAGSTTTTAVGGGGPCDGNDFQDTFDGPDLSSLWAPDPADPSVIGVDDGVLFMNLPPSPNAEDFYVEVTSSLLCNMQDSAVWLEVPTVFAGSPPAEIFFGIWTEADGDWFECKVNSGMFSCRAAPPVPSVSEMIPVPFDPSAHRWWRIRHDGDSTLFETSSDGSSYEPRWEIPSPEGLDSIGISFGAGTWGATLDELRAEFDNVNALPVARSPRLEAG